jgi:hypothetical protein
MTRPYTPNTIVIVQTNDALYGRVRVPGIIRYYDEALETYEVNVFLPTAEGRAAGAADIGWWTVTEDEIVRQCELATIERSANEVLAEMRRLV